MPRTVHLLVSGLVQGVSYRASARDEAAQAGLAGWVRNLPSGDVEAVAQGPDDAVARFIGWCHRGPPEARVSGVVVDERPHDGALGAFTVRR